MPRKASSPMPDGDDDDDVLGPQMTIWQAAAAAATAATAAEASSERTLAASTALDAARRTAAEAREYAAASAHAVEVAPANRERAINTASHLEALQEPTEARAKQVVDVAKGIQDEADRATRFAAGARRAGAKWAMNATRRAKQLEGDALDARRAAEKAMQSVAHVRAQLQDALRAVEAALDEEGACRPRAVAAAAAIPLADEAAAAAERTHALAAEAEEAAQAAAAAARSKERAVRAMHRLKNRDVLRGFQGWVATWHERLRQKELISTGLRNMRTRELRQATAAWKEEADEIAEGKAHGKTLLRHGGAHCDAKRRRWGWVGWREYHALAATRAVLETARRRVVCEVLAWSVERWVGAWTAGIRRRVLLGRALEYHEARIQPREARESVRAWEAAAAASLRELHRAQLRRAHSTWARAARRNAALSVALGRTTDVASDRNRRRRVRACFAAWTGLPAAHALMRTAVQRWTHRHLVRAIQPWKAATIWRATLQRKLRDGDRALLQIANMLSSRALHYGFQRWKDVHLLHAGRGSGVVGIAARYFGKTSGATPATPVQDVPPRNLPDEAAEEAKSADFWRQMEELRVAAANGHGAPPPPKVPPLSDERPLTARPAMGLEERATASMPARPHSARVFPHGEIGLSHAPDASGRPTPMMPHRPAPAISPFGAKSSLLHRAQAARARRSAKVRAI